MARPWPLSLATPSSRDWSCAGREPRGERGKAKEPIGIGPDDDRAVQVAPVDATRNVAAPGVGPLALAPL